MCYGQQLPEQIRKGKRSRGCSWYDEELSLCDWHAAESRGEPQKDRILPLSKPKDQHQFLDASVAYQGNDNGSNLPNNAQELVSLRVKNLALSSELKMQCAELARLRSMVRALDPIEDELSATKKELQELNKERAGLLKEVAALRCELKDTEIFCRGYTIGNRELKTLVNALQKRLVQQKHDKAKVEKKLEMVRAQRNEVTSQILRFDATENQSFKTEYCRPESVCSC